MYKDVILSVILHVAVVAATLMASPFDFERKKDYGEVIRINAVSWAEIRPPEPEPVVPIDVPQALEAEPDEIPITDPSTKPAAEVDEPAEQPEEKPPEEKTTKPPIATTGEKSQAGAEDGQTEVTPPAGTMISGVTVDNVSFNYPYWFTLTWGKINQNFRVPVTIDGKVYCDVYFQVIKSGRVIETEVVSQSGIRAFDNACLAAIERSAPFPPLPRQFLDEIIGITITFTN